MTDMISISRTAGTALLTALAAVEDLGPDEQLALHDLQHALETPAPWVLHPEMVTYWRTYIDQTSEDIREQVETHARLIAQEMRISDVDPDNPHLILAAAFGAASVLTLAKRASDQGSITMDQALIASALARQTFAAIAILGLQAGIE